MIVKYVYVCICVFVFVDLYFVTVGTCVYVCIRCDEWARKQTWELGNCREKTASRGENYVYWRLNVNLQNTECRNNTIEFMDEIFSSYE